MASDGMGGMMENLKAMENGAKMMRIYANLLRSTEKRIMAVIKRLGVKDKERLAEELASDRLEWMMTDLPAVTEQMEGLEGEEGGN